MLEVKYTLQVKYTFSYRVTLIMIRNNKKILNVLLYTTHVSNHFVHIVLIRK